MTSQEAILRKLFAIFEMISYLKLFHDARMSRNLNFFRESNRLRLNKHNSVINTFCDGKIRASRVLCGLPALPEKP